MHFWIEDFNLKKSFLSKKRILVFKYFTGYNWRKLKISLPLSYSADMSFYTNTMINAITEDLKKKHNRYEEYIKMVPFYEQLNKKIFLNSIKIGR